MGFGICGPTRKFLTSPRVGVFPHSRLSPIWMFFLCFLLQTTGCGGGGGGGDAPPNPNPPDLSGRISGQLIVPPSHSLEQEPNNDISQAQRVQETSVVFGDAGWQDDGIRLDGREIKDLYSLEAPGPMQAVLTIGAENVYLNDLDLYLMDETGSTIGTARERGTTTETINILEAGSYLVGIRVNLGSTSYVLSFSGSVDLSGGYPDICPPNAAFVPGQVLVKRKPSSRQGLRSTQSLAAAHGLRHKETFPRGVELLELAESPERGVLNADPGTQAGQTPSGETSLRTLTLERIRSLRRDPSVQYAEPNYIRRPLLVPNDPGFELQWHYELINLPQAWDVTTGDPDVVVAVVDSGVVLDHPDLIGRFTDGFDFIRDEENANDGDGIDPDPTDPGDDPTGRNSSFHGTHVAGTIGARTNNGAGVAGTTWQTRLMPLRVAGVTGGEDADIAQAIFYAAGLPNSSGILPSQPADIINISLGGPGTSFTLQNAVRAARDAGAVVLAAAGNENSSGFSSPASLDGVISVAAVDINAQKAPYSNYGRGIDIAAPGGNTSVDQNGDTYADGVLSTLADDAGDFIYRFYQGTSMACPHVAGVLALMLAVNPALTPQDMDLLISGTHPSTNLRITRDLGIPGRDDIYGNGLIDASQALVAAQALGGDGPDLPSESILAVSTESLNFEGFISALSFAVTNAGTSTLNVSTSLLNNASWLILAPSSGTAPLTIKAIVNRNGLSAGTHTAAIRVQSDATQGPQTRDIRVTVEVDGDTHGGDVGEIYVLVLDPATEEFDTVEQAVTNTLMHHMFTTPTVPPGTYMVVAGTDRDDDGYICDLEDACGFYPDLIVVDPGKNTSNITFVLGELVSPQQAAEAALDPERLAGRTFRRIR